MAGKKKNTVEKKASSENKTSNSMMKKVKEMKWWQGLMVLGPIIAILFSGGSQPLTYLSATDETEMRSVFFSGSVWAVACSDKNGAAPENWESVAARLQSDMKFGVVDCAAKMPSGRTIYQRWKFTRDQPTIFVANGVQVTQIQGARTEYDLVRELRLAAIRTPVTLTSPAQFSDKCLAKPRCLLVLQGGVELEPTTSKAVDALMGSYSTSDRPVSFAMLDAANWKLDFEGFDNGDSAKLRRFEPGSHRFIYFLNSTDLIYTLAYHKGSFTESAIASFLDGLAEREAKNEFSHLVKLTDGPTLIKRPKSKPKRKPPPPPPPKDERPASSSKIPETLTDEERRKLQQEQRERESKARESMDAQQADSAYVPEEVDEDDANGDDVEDPDEEEIEEI